MLIQKVLFDPRTLASAFFPWKIFLSQEKKPKNISNKKRKIVLNSNQIKRMYENKAKVLKQKIKMWLKILNRNK